MGIKEMYDLWCEGLTYREIAEKCGCSYQCVWEKVVNYREKIETGRRGHKFFCNEIKWQGLYDWFVEHEFESITSLCKKCFGNGSANHGRMKSLLTGDRTAFFNIDQIKKICDVIGKPFEEVFKEREGE